MSDPRIEALEAGRDLALVQAFYAEAGDYWLLADRALPGPQKAAAFFTDGPPGCDPATSLRLGLFEAGRLMGLAELSFGFPAAGDGYLGLMLLHPDARGRGLGRRFLQGGEVLARAAGCALLYLAVLEENPRGRSFWEREGFAATGVTRDDPETGHRIHRLVKPLG